MQRLPEGYDIASAAYPDIRELICVDLAAGQMFAPTGLLPPAALDDHVPARVLEVAMTAGNLIVVRAEDRAIAGFALVSHREEVLYLDQISVHPGHGRKGLGRALVRRVLDTAKERGVKHVVLSTFRDVPWNGPFYRTLGFREIPRARMAGWMLQIEAVQAEVMDVTPRCFMQARVRWL